MGTFKLHTKTTLLSSVIIVAMLVAALVITSAAIANLERSDDQRVAEIQAQDLAQHITDMRSHDPETLIRAATLIKGTRPNITAVRIWELSNGEFNEEAAAAGSEPSTPIPEDAMKQLRAGAAPKIVAAAPATASLSVYRIFAATSENGRPRGAVEIEQRFDGIWVVALRYLKNVIWLMMIAITLVMLGTYYLFRQLQLTTKLETEKGILRERVRDATLELRKRNQQLQETNLELWNTNRRMNELGRLAAAGQTAAQFAHEVGTPLNLISGHVQLFKSDLDRDPRDAEARIKTISAQIERIERIVRRMLDKTRFEPELSPLDLNGVLRKLCDAMSPAFDKHNIRVAKAFADNLPLMAGSSDRLQQLFLNLINNSLDAMSAGGEIQIGTALDGNSGHAQRIVVDFVDSGSGMTPDVMKHIFDPLYTTKDRGRGTGLGLVIVKQVVTELGGTVRVESELGEGTHFRLTFPALPIDTPIVVEDQEHEAEEVA
jgi:signal transduction histidine kinase